jgi:FkbM family methyltransferase
VRRAGRAARLFDRRGSRAALGVALSVRRSRQFGRPARVAWQDGRWIFKLDGRVVLPDVHGWADTRAWDRLAADVFFWHDEPRPGDVVVDVGAGVGTELFAFADRVGPTGTVHALEAHPATFEALRALVQANAGGAVKCGVVVERVAITDHVGTVEIADSDLDIGNWLVDSCGVPTPATTLDDYVVAHRIDRIGFLKMNIEGAEAGALRAGAQALAITRRGAISCHDFKADRTGNEYFRTKAEVRGLLLEAGFEVTERPDAPDPWTRDYLYISRV